MLLFLFDRFDWKNLANLIEKFFKLGKAFLYSAKNTALND